MMGDGHLTTATGVITEGDTDMISTQMYLAKLPFSDRLDVWCYAANALCHATHDPPMQRRAHLQRLLGRFVRAEADALLDDPSAGAGGACATALTTNTGDRLVAQCVRGVGHGCRAMAVDRTARGMVADVLVVALEVGLRPGSATAAALARLRREVHPLAEDDETVASFFTAAMEELCDLSATYPMAPIE